jgi:hypothetical protein
LQESERNFLILEDAIGAGNISSRFPHIVVSIKYYLKLQTPNPKQITEFPNYQIIKLSNYLSPQLSIQSWFKASRA